MQKQTFNIEYLSNYENELVKKANEEYGDVLENAHNLIAFIWRFISKVDPISYIFVSFLTQVRKSLTLALLSTIRKHIVQANMMLRQALESAVLACFGLVNPKEDVFLVIDEQTGIARENEVLKKAYRWLENEYRGYSDKIKYIKGIINKLYAHSFIIQTSWNFDFSRSGMTSSFHDSIDELLTKHYLWSIADISFNLLDLFSNVIKQYPNVKLIDDFEGKMKEFSKENERIKEALMKNPRFSRWLDFIKSGKKID